jgi:hypothetical protein
METIQNHRTSAGFVPALPSARISSETHQVITLGEREGWHSAFLGQAQLPDETVHLENWMIVPAAQDSSEIPLRTYRRIQTLFANGIRPQGFVVVHETPRLLSQPKSEPKPASRQGTPRFQGNPEIVSSAAQSVFSGMTKAVLGSLPFLFGTIALGIAMIDPIVVAVMEDGSWIEIDRWETQA